VDQPPVRVSVVIPTYNCAGYLTEAIHSVLEQTTPAFEIIVVDDGSTDDTAAIVAGLGDRVTYLQQANAGVAAARNAGLRRATGDVIAFLDADDFWAPDKLATQLVVLDRCPEVDLVCSDFWVAGDDRRRSFIRRKYRVFSAYRLDWPAIFASRLYLRRGTLEAWVGRAFGPLFLGNFVNTSSVLLRRRVVERVGGFAEHLRTQEDYEYWLRIARDGAFAVVDRPLLAFRYRPDQLTAPDQRLRLAQDVLTVIERMLPHAAGVLSPALIAERMSERYAAVAVALLAARQQAHGRQLLRRAFAHRPLSVLASGLLVWSFLPHRVGGALRKALSTFRGAVAA
jgi:glycosyltransferase involved in cell wall biosynthesis